MTHSRTWLASAAAFALLFGLELPDPKLTGEHFPLPNDQTRVAAADQGLDGDGPAQPDACRTARAAPLLISRPLD
jgi:hypothetical protein